MGKRKDYYNVKEKIASFIPCCCFRVNKLLNMIVSARVILGAPGFEGLGDGEVGVALETLRRVSTLSSAQWVFVSSQSERRPFRVIARDVALDADDDMCVVLSPVACFNLGMEGKSDESVRVDTNMPQRPCACFRDRALGIVKPLRCIYPPEASEVTIARVKTPASSGYADYSQLLKKYFSKKRRVRVGDIIVVGAALEDIRSQGRSNDNMLIEPEGIVRVPRGTSNGEESDAETDELALRLDAYTATGELHASSMTPVYFQVTSAQGSCPGCWFGGDVACDAQSTRIAQAGAVQAFVPSPRQVSMYMSGIFSEQDLPVDEKVADALANAILPSLFPDSIHASSASATLLHGQPSVGKRVLARAVARRYGIHFFKINLLEIRGLGEKTIASKFEALLDEAILNAPCMVYLRGVEVLASESPSSISGAAEKGPTVAVTMLKDGLIKIAKRASEFPVAVVGSTSMALADIPASLRACFFEDVKVPAPTANHRERILCYLMRHLQLGGGTKDDHVDAHALAAKLSGRTPMDMVQLISNAAARARGILSASILEEAIRDLPPPSSMSVDAPKIPEVKWEDVGGLGDARQEITDLIQLPLLHPELFTDDSGEGGGGGRSGILLYGPPGTGKTLLAKAVATECNLNFISVKGPELLDMYVGESERKVRAVFELARTASPSVLFFDELDSLAPQRGRGSDGGGVMDRVVSQLLTELSGVQELDASKRVFVIGATNRPDLLDQSLLRPGRFDRLVYLGVSSNHDDRAKIIRALSRKFALHQDVDLDAVAQLCPQNFTGADFSAVCSEAMGSALRRRVEALQRQVDEVNANDLYSSGECTPFSLLESMSDDELQIVVTMEDYIAAAKSVVPSVSPDELAHYERLRAQFSKGNEKKSA